MSTQQKTDIAIELSIPDGRPEAKIHFNKIKSTQTILWPRNGDENDFLHNIELAINSTFSQAAPLPSKTSAGLTRFTPQTIAVFNHSEYPVADELFGEVQAVANLVMMDWAGGSNGSQDENQSENPS
jgi:hypothetical protein